MGGVDGEVEDGVRVADLGEACVEMCRLDNRTEYKDGEFTFYWGYVTALAGLGVAFTRERFAAG